MHRHGRPGADYPDLFSHQVLCERYLLDGVIAVDAVHADQQMDQFTIAQSQVGYADRILLTKTDVAGDTESCVNGWRALTRGRRFIPSFTAISI